jgi:PAS domain S-box-containing protein
MKTASSLVRVTAAIRDADTTVEKLLSRQKNSYRDLLEAAPDAMVVVNQGGDIVLLNLQAEKHFGYPCDELLGQAVKNIIPEGFTERLMADELRSAEDALAQQMGTGIELVGRRKDGSEFPIELMLSPLKSAEGIFVTAAIRDITARHLIDEERKRLARLKDEFVATVSHELRTPLTSICGSIGLLTAKVAGDLPDPAPRMLAIAHTNCQRLVRLVDDILDIGRMESGQVVFHFTRVEARALVEQVIEANRGYAETRRVRIRLEDACAVGEVRADRDRLTQVVTNLLSNAIKFSPTDDEVVVAIESRSEFVRISLRNHGPGIRADFKPHIFERFAQADATTTRQQGGSGLGLSIVKHLVDRLGGEVGFSDAPGETIFHVDIPCWEHLVSMAIDRDAAPDALRILLCEDDPDMAVVLREQLRRVGFATDFAYTAGDAITCTEATQYCAILVDLLLPDSNGIDLIVRLRELPQYAEIPIIVVSVNPSRGREDPRSSQLNVFQWLSKPVDFDHLIKVLPKQRHIVY